MAIKDAFADVDARATDGSTGVDLRGYSAVGILIRTGTSPSALAITASDDDATYAAVSANDIIYTDSAGAPQTGLPALADDTELVVRYRGTARYLRAAGTNLTASVLRGCPDRGSIPQPIAAP